MLYLMRIGVRNARVLSAFEALGQQAAPVVPELQHWLCSTNTVAVDTAARVLGYIHPEGTYALMAASTNQAVPDKVSVLLSLRGLISKHPEVAAAFLIKADDPNPEVRALVFGILFPIGVQESESLFPVVIRLLADPVSPVRHKVLSALNEFKGNLRPAEPVLAVLVANPDPEISSKANALLQKIKAQSITLPSAPTAPPP